MDLTRFFGKTRTHVFRVLENTLLDRAQCLERSLCISALDGDGIGLTPRGGSFGHNGGRHRLLGDIERTAKRTADFSCAYLCVVVGAGAKPAFKFMPRRTSQKI